MSNIVSKIRQRIALKKSNKFDLSCDHITTSDFYKLAPVYFKEMVPGESINIKQTTFTRLSPMVKPMYGRCRIENRAFFVPMRTIMKGWNEFITETPYNNIFLTVPQIYPSDLTTAFSNVELSKDVTSNVSSDATYTYDWKTSASTPSYYRFTNVGKQAWTILQSLGYRTTLGLSNSFDIENNKMSALPLLAFFKIYKDWYKALAYQTTVFDGIFDISVNIAQTSGRLTGAVLEPLLGLCGRVNYDKDYFSSAWDKPVAPNDGLIQGHDIKDVSNTSSYLSSGLNPAVITNNATELGGSSTSTPNISGTGSAGAWSATSHPKITQYAIDALKALTDYVKRHQLAGGLALDRMMSRFGIKPSDAALDRSTYLGKNTVDVQIADVMATGNGESTIGSVTNKSSLGEYAGKGIGVGSDAFSYKTDEYGYIMILSSIIPHVGYVQGMSRYVFHKDKLDFFTPEFDSLGVQAIARKELLSDYNLISGSPSDDLVNGIFGFTSRYAEYKTSTDNLSGDFTCASLNEGMDTWHLNRMFNPTATGFGTSNVTHSFNFVRPSDASQYARVFAYQGSDYDHFYNVHHFDIEDWAPMSQLFDDYDFDGGSKEVTIDVNGTQLN